MAILEMNEIRNAVKKGNSKNAVSCVRDALDLGTAPLEILHEGLVAGFDDARQLYQDGIYFIPELLVSIEALEKGMDLIKPLIPIEDLTPYGTIVIGTVKGDIHDIGKNIVATMLSAGGFNVIDLGCDVSPAAFCDAIVIHKPQIVAMSALLTTTSYSIVETLQMIEERALRNQLKILVGGTVINDKLAKSMGADGYAKDASTAVEVAKQLVDGYSYAK